MFSILTVYPESGGSVAQTFVLNAIDVVRKGCIRR